MKKFPINLENLQRHKIAEFFVESIYKNFCERAGFKIAYVYADYIYLKCQHASE